MIRKIVSTQDPLLRQVAKPVGKIDKKILTLITDMQQTLAVQKDPEGVGLAAPQVGKNLQLFVVDFANTQRVVINPTVLSTQMSKTKAKKKTPRTKITKKNILEGCLSLPNFYGPLKRAEKITIKYTDEKGKDTTETFTGFVAQIIQHEIDHLNGILFIDHILSQKAPLYRFRGKEWEEVELT